MSRPLTGRVEEKNGRFQASVPSTKGSAQRISYTFDTREQADAWRVAAVAAIAAGAPIPGRDTASAPQVPAAPPRTSAVGDAAVRTPVRTSAEQYFDAYYVDAEGSQLKRAETVRSNLTKIVDFLGL